MTFIDVKRMVRVVPVLAVVVLAGSARSGSAASCSADLAQCYQAAAGLSAWFDRAAAGLDCEVSFSWCLLEALNY